MNTVYPSTRCWYYWPSHYYSTVAETYSSLIRHLTTHNELTWTIILTVTSHYVGSSKWSSNLKYSDKHTNIRTPSQCTYLWLSGFVTELDQSKKLGSKEGSYWDTLRQWELKDHDKLQHRKCTSTWLLVAYFCCLLVLRFAAWVANLYNTSDLQLHWG